MKRFLALSVASLLCFGTASVISAAEEKVEIKDNGKEYKMKVKRKGEHDWVGVYNDREYVLRGEPTVFTTVKEPGEYTVWGTIAPDNTYVTTTKITRVDVK
jgi:hypothetical protein